MPSKAPAELAGSAWSALEVSALMAQAALYLSLLNLTSIFDLRLVARKIISGRLVIRTQH